MAKILLISANTTEDPYPVYPLGMSMVAAALRQSGQEVSEWDLYHGECSLPAMQQKVRDDRPDVIGLSLRNVDTVNYNEPTSYVSAYREIVESLRQVSDATVVLGGSAFTIFPQEIMALTEADYGIAGEGDDAFCDLIEQLENGTPPSDRVIYSKPSLEGRQFSALTRNEELANFYQQKGGMLSVQTKRGCPHRCSYCSYPVLEGKRYRYREAGDVVDEIEMLIKKYGASYYSITDSVFNDARGDYLKIAEELVRRNIDTPWMCFLRPRKFKKDEVELLKRAGLSSVEWGTDCSTDTTLKAMQKDFNWDMVMAANKVFAEADISNGHFIIMGGPNETHATATEGLKNIEALQKCVVFSFIGVRIFPNTPIHRRAIAEGVISEDQSLVEPTFYFSSHIDIPKLHQQILDSFNNRIDRVYPGGQFVEKTKALYMFGHRGPAWDLLLKTPTKRGREWLEKR